MSPDIETVLSATQLANILVFMRWSFYILAVLLVFRLCFHFAPYRIGHRHRLILFPLLFLAAFVGILAYQAYWQIFGLKNKDFFRFMERYNARTNNVVRCLVRGSILDCNGRVLASTVKEGGMREYNYASAAAHVVGFRHPTLGLTGIENAADRMLSGYEEIHSKEQIKDGLANEGKIFFSGDFARSVGTNVVLTIDAKLQTAAMASWLRNGLSDKCGAAVAIEPSTGAIRLLFSAPTFDPNNFDRRLNSDPRSPLLNRALHGRYPAGSTFKTMIAALLVDSGKLSPPYNLTCNVNGYNYRNRWRRPIRDHGTIKEPNARGDFTVDLRFALAKSSNTYFAQAGTEYCGPEAFNAFADKLCVRERLPLFADGDAMVSCQAGNIPRLGLAERQELSQLSIGQGRLLVTPMHMAMLTSAIANGGILMRPHLAADAEPEVLSKIVSKKAANTVKDAMRAVVQIGTGRSQKWKEVGADDAGWNVCGKTGTAQNPLGKDHAWFVCFAPMENPQIAVAVLVENAGFGSTIAMPVAADILKQYFTDNLPKGVR